MEGRSARVQKKKLILPLLPSYDEKNRKLAKYMDYCCRFSWRTVTQLPPLKLNYQSQYFDERSNVPAFESERNKLPRRK